MSDTPRPPAHATLSQVMLPGDANPVGNVHGGTIMKLVDTAGAIAAHRHARRRVVTIEVDSMTFLQPVHVGDLVTLEATVTAVWHTSIETRVEVTAEHVVSGLSRHASTAFVVYVALDEAGQPTAVPPLLLSTAAERELARQAEARRQRRLAARQQQPGA